MITQSHAGTLMARIVAASAITHNDGTPARFTPHDFRRIFATAAVAAGLPVHIAAKVLGHDNLNTTQGYVAVYDHDVIEHHRAFIARRRQQRPSAEYRDVTDADWDRFLAHFEKRKVELGTCGRAYATPCVHEHACIRCPLLRRPDPKQLDRLTEIHTDLLARIDEANQRGWIGELEASTSASPRPNRNSTKCTAARRTRALSSSSTPRTSTVTGNPTAQRMNTRCVAGNRTTIPHHIGCNVHPLMYRCDHVPSDPDPRRARRRARCIG